MTALFAVGPADVVALAAIALVVAAIVYAVRAIGRVPSSASRVPLVPARARSRHPAVIRQLDPDAAGRPRPRAPGA
jgi:Family of unknown function (DUF6412)